MFTFRQPLILLWTLFCLTALMTMACSSAYYGAMEKAGIHKRDILVDRVENARDSQAEAQQQFKSALEQFQSVVQLRDTDLKMAYDKMKAAYDDSKAAAEDVSDRINRVESVAEALFEEWEKELELYESKELQKASKNQLEKTKIQYHKMIGTMRQAEKTMEPVLRTFNDNVLFLKHNLNAQAIGSLKGEFSDLESKIDSLIQKMNTAIDESNTFIAGLKQ